MFAKKPSCLEVVARDYSASLAVLTFRCIISQNIDFAIKSKAALIFVHSMNVIPQEYWGPLVS